MTVRHLKIFLAVYRAQSITRAAGELHMTQPAVTRAVQELERYYGVCLFERCHRRLSATECAGQLYAQALHIVESFDRMETDLRNWEELGVLRVGASITLGNFLLPELVQELAGRYPSLQIRAMVASGAQIQQALLENRLDVALIEGEAKAAHLHAEAFAKDRLLLILPPEHPLCGKPAIDLRDLADYPLLLREQGSAGRSFLDHVFAVHGVSVSPAWESVSTQALVKAVGLGLGVSILPEQLVRTALEAGTIVTRAVQDEPFTRQNFVVWHENKFLTASARDFIKLCKTASGRAAES